MAEKAISAIKSGFDPTVLPYAWYRKFRDLVETTTVYNLEQALKR